MFHSWDVRARLIVCIFDQEVTFWSLEKQIYLKNWQYKLTGYKQVPLKGHATTTFENVSQKNWKVFWNIFHFCHRWIWCDEKIKEYLTFYAYFTRMQKFFHFRRWEFFFKKQLYFSGKKLFFVNVFSKKWLMIIVQHIWFHPFLFSFFDATWTLTDKNFDRIRNESVHKKNIFQLLWFTLERY